jgi:hypothetical protein
MAKKFGLSYFLKVENSNGDMVEITMPFSVQFSVQRSITGGANSAHFTLFNLAETTRNVLYKDQYSMEYRVAQMFAGYEDGAKTLLPMIFNGTVRVSQSARNGIDFITEIECFDGAFAMTSGKTAIVAAAGQAMKDTLKDLMSNLPGVTGSTVGGGYETENKRGNIMFGNPVEYLKLLSQNRFFIDQNHAYVLADNETIKGDIETIDASTGLIGAPKKSNTLVEVETIFEPRIQIAQTLELISTTNKRLNGIYKVLECNHSGMISPTVSSSVTTQLKLYKDPNGSFIEVPK